MHNSALARMGNTSLAVVNPQSPALYAFRLRCDLDFAQFALTIPAADEGLR